MGDYADGVPTFQQQLDRVTSRHPRCSCDEGLGSTHTLPPVSADTVSLGIQVNWHAFVAVIFTQQRQRGAC